MEYPPEPCKPCDSAFFLQSTTGMTLRWTWVADGEINELRLTQDLSIASDEGPFQWLAGGYFEASGYDLGYIGIEPKPAGSPFRSLGEEEVLVLALCGRSDWQFQKNLYLTGGLRLDHSQHDLNAAATLGSQPPRRLILGSLAIALEATLHTRGVASLFVRGVRSLPSAS